MSVYSVPAILLVVPCLIFLWLLKITSERNKTLEKEKQELVTENEKLEYFLSEYFLLRMNDQELLEAFSTILDNYTQSKELPENFLCLVCGYSRSYKIMHTAILLEIDRWGRFILDKETAQDLKKATLPRQSKFYDLLEELELANIKKNGRVSITDIGGGSLVRDGLISTE